MNLRPYQQNAVNSIRETFLSGINKLILCSPTGSGKTVIFSFITKSTQDKGNRILIITDRIELLTQSGGTVNKLGIDFGYLSAKTKIVPKESVVISMIETLNNRIKKPEYKDFIQSFDLIVIDECHKRNFDKLWPVLKPTQRIIGATATPIRQGVKNQLKDYYQKIIDVCQIPELIADGYLVPAISYGEKVDLSNIKLKGGEYDENQLTEMYKHKYESVIINYKKYSQDKKTLIFCASVKNSQDLCDIFHSSGFNSKHIDATSKDRSEILTWFKKTDNAILCNVGILTTGFDEPSIQTVILYRATTSMALFLQMCGRGSRLFDNKTHFTILDFGNNILNHGFWEQPRKWSLELEKKKKGPSETRAKECPKCGALLSVATKVCQYCGYIYPIPKKQEIEMILEKLTYKEIESIESIPELEKIREFKGYKQGWILRKFKTPEQFIEYGKLKKYHYKWAEHKYNYYNNEN